MQPHLRQVVLDTETTGLDPSLGHRVIEIGALEVVNRRITGATYHVYLNPDRDIDAGAIAVHGITNEYLADKPRFADVAQEFLEFVRDSELIIHNAPFDVGFLNAELTRLNEGPLSKFCGVLDTLKLAKEIHPGQKNNLDALCKRYQVDNSGRNFHGALLDAQLLAEVYLGMTRGQETLGIDVADMPSQRGSKIALPLNRGPLRVLRPDAHELAEHEAYVEALGKDCGEVRQW